MSRKQRNGAELRKIKEFFNFIQDVRAEAFKITWPKRDVVVRSSILILVFAAMMALYFFVLDWVLNKIVGWVF